MSYLVIGGTGFIGSHLVKELVNRGLQVVTLSPSGNTSRLGDAATRVRVERGSVTELPDILQAIKRNSVRRIAYLAAESPPWTPMNVTKTMMIGFLNVLEAARIMDVERLVWASSYAQLGPPELYCSERVNEDAPAKPVSPHGVSYIANEFAAEFYASNYGLDVLGMRLGLVFGLGRDRSGFMDVLVDLFEAAASGRPVRVPQGDSVWVLQYVKESANVMAFGLEVERHQSRVYNTCDEALSLRQLAGIVGEFVPDARIEVEPGGRTVRALVDAGRIRRELGYAPKYTVRDGVRDYLEALGARIVPGAGGMVG
ncbi:MAG: NAD-dependent epimerase/dehydratase family protein [Conexivisphaera sp.]|jgi:UDP-glucose 4-epimerase